uniref:CSON013757 protein n=1 Tax=Culicoides sonorensis TaxID=179676 RepID=A0A336MCN6_CULSO
MNLDVNFNNMSRRKALEKYVICINKLQEDAIRNHINEKTFQQHVIQQYRNDWSYKYLVFYKICSTCILKHLITYKLYFINFVLLLLLIFTIQIFKTEAHAFFIRTIQPFIYPFLKLCRKVAIPILYLLPKISLLYDETCFVSNPYFQTNNIKCDECQHINVLDLSGKSHLIDINNNFPFIITVDVEIISEQDFQQFLSENKDKTEIIRSLSDYFVSVFNNTNVTKNHKSWKCNTMQCARILKRLIPRPIDIPKEMSMGITRYLLFDTKDSQAYRIPDGDCDLSFARQVIGSRTFVLRPHPECGDICKKLTINLTEKHICKER